MAPESIESVTQRETRHRHPLKMKTSTPAKFGAIMAYIEIHTSAPPGHDCQFAPADVLSPRANQRNNRILRAPKFQISTSAALAHLAIR